MCVCVCVCMRVCLCVCVCVCVCTGGGRGELILALPQSEFGGERERRVGQDNAEGSRLMLNPPSWDFTDFRTLEAHRQRQVRRVASTWLHFTRTHRRLRQRKWFTESYFRRVTPRVGPPPMRAYVAFCRAAVIIMRRLLEANGAGRNALEGVTVFAIPWGDPIAQARLMCAAAVASRVA